VEGAGGGGPQTVVQMMQQHTAWHIGTSSTKQVAWTAVAAGRISYSLQICVLDAWVLSSDDDQ
jgi:hypothetical protein